mmetsp:Transcript_19005/g.54184  ORF Transcript_19005/g.54184 Transcript_19005/m.54184 type:complete len:251 (-) Transcript_19005:82-834(-)
MTKHGGATKAPRMREKARRDLARRKARRRGASRRADPRRGATARRGGVAVWKPTRSVRRVQREEHAAERHSPLAQVALVRPSDVQLVVQRGQPPQRAAISSATSMRSFWTQTAVYSSNFWAIASSMHRRVASILGGMVTNDPASYESSEACDCTSTLSPASLAWAIQAKRPRARCKVLASMVAHGQVSLTGAINAIRRRHNSSPVGSRSALPANFRRPSLTGSKHVSTVLMPPHLLPSILPLPQHFSSTM